MGRRNLDLLILVSSISFLGSFCAAFDPVDNYLINCGASTNSSVGNRVFVADNLASNLLSTSHNVLASTTLESVPSSEHSVLLRTARVFDESAKYNFPIKQSGRHWIRLYFHPFSYNSYDLSSANFAVRTSDCLLLYDFKVQNTSVVKEFSVNVTSNNLELNFYASNNSFAFVNAIEVVSVPDGLISNDGIGVSQAGKAVGLLPTALETVWRVNIGGPVVTADNDTLWRTWIPDTGFLMQPHRMASYSNIKAVKYVPGGATKDSAPEIVYGTAGTGVGPYYYNVMELVTWEFNVDPGFQYLLRFHICDIASKSVNELFFNLFVDSLLVKTVDRNSVPVANILGAAFYIDFVTKSIVDNQRSIKVGYVALGPSSRGILNGIEIMKISNSQGSLSSAAVNFSALRLKRNPGLVRMLKVIGGLTIGAVVATILVGILFPWYRNRRRPTLQVHSKTWIPVWINGGNSPFTGKEYLKSIDRYRIPFAAVQESTNNFDESRVIGVGGFGKVYKGVLNGTKVAVKRSNPQSQQGLREFQTEIVMLSRFRHRHLVSLVGYCDEENEMILIYEYMENGTLKSHLYGSGLPSLSWKQRLQICIGAAKGLHYLHTGHQKAIIHRDVKSANILLGENLMAKVADFGLSRPGPEIDQTHVSTAIKGSFGYLDPEYFKMQRLTDKSDVYSFGVVLFEVLCARPAIDTSLPSDLVSLSECAMKWQERGQLEQIMDSALVGKVIPDSLRKYGETAESCLAKFGSDRPSMGEVLSNLEHALQLQEAAIDGDLEENDTIMIELPPRVDSFDDCNGSVLGMLLKSSSTTNNLSCDSMSMVSLTHSTVSDLC